MALVADPVRLRQLPPVQLRRFLRGPPLLGPRLTSRLARFRRGTARLAALSCPRRTTRERVSTLAAARPGGGRNRQRAALGGDPAQRAENRRGGRGLVALDAGTHPL